MRDFLESDWFRALRPHQQELFRLSVMLHEREERSQTSFSDYGFVVFPGAKAYEGFLKQYLYDLELITERTFNGRRFRIGRAINPDVRIEQRDEFWLYDDIEHMCGSELAQTLWDTWLTCRNQVFHYFPDRKVTINLETAGEYITLIGTSIEAAHQCQIDLEGKTEETGS